MTKTIDTYKNKCLELIKDKGKLHALKYLHQNWGGMLREEKEIIDKWVLDMNDTEVSFNEKAISMHNELVEALKIAEPYLIAWRVKEVEPLVGENLERDINIINEVLTKAKQSI